jgi:cytochrome P450
MVVFSHPDHVERVFEASPDDLLGGHANAVFSLALGPRNLLSLDGAEHDRVRRHIGRPLAYRQVPTYTARIGAVVHRHVAGWPAGVAVDLQGLMQRLALDVVLDVLLGPSATRIDDLRGAVLDLVDRIAELGTRPRRRGSFAGDDPLATSGRKVRRLCAEELLRCREGNATGGSMLEQLASGLVDGSPETDAVLDQLVAFLIAGHETTATALTWAIARIVDTDGLLPRLFAEVDRPRGSSASTPFLDAAILETLRLHPAFPILPRTVTRLLEIGPYRLVPGDVVAPCSYLSHRHPAVWTEPERFDPTRFVGRRPGPPQFYPFGSGARRCIGMHFALLEMRIVLAHTLSRWRVQCLAAVPRPVRRSLTLAPGGGVQVFLTQRDVGRVTHSEGLQPVRSEWLGLPGSGPPCRKVRP